MNDDKNDKIKSKKKKKKKTYVPNNWKKENE